MNFKNFFSTIVRDSLLVPTRLAQNLAVLEMKVRVRVEKKAETNGKKRYYGLLPSSSELQNWAKKVEDVSTVLCGNLWEPTTLPDGSCGVHPV